jgi:MFS family permease
MTTTRVFLLLTLLTTLATSLIWGIDTVFLLNAGLSNAHVFLVNAGFMIGQLLFEVPTGVVADTWGRKWSFLIGCLWLAAATVLYAWLGVNQATFWVFGFASAMLGIGFTFFTGATEAWLVDELKRQGKEAAVESVLGQAQSVGGIAMLSGAVAGGFLAQWFGLPIPYLIRAFLLLVSFLTAWVVMTEQKQKSHIDKLNTHLERQ